MNKKLTFTPVTETIQSVYRGDKRYELSDHLGNVHVVVTDRKELHCGLEDNVPFPEYYTAEVKNRYDYYPFGMLMEERKYGASVCRYDIDTSFIATVMDQNFEEDPTLDAWLYAISSATPNYGGGSMLLDYDQEPLITYWPADEGDRYKVTFSFSFEGDCDSLQVLGNVQNSTTQSYTSGGTYTFDFTVNDVSGGYGVFGFYKDNPDCIVYIHSVKIEQYTTSTQVVCDTDSVAGYRYGYNGKSKDDEIYEIEGTVYDFGARLYDSRLGRWMAVDPLAGKYTSISPFVFVNNMPIIAIDPNGKDIWVVVSWPTGLYGTDDSGHMKLYATTYKEVKVQVEENGKVITKTYYEKTGYVLIDNWPNGNNKSATRINYISEAEYVNSIKNETVAYRVDSEKGVQGNTFNNALNPTIDVSKTYYSEAEVKAELGILEKAKKLSADNTKKYDHGDGYASQNDCSSIIVNLLLSERLISDKNLGVTTVTVNGKNYSFYTPNEIALDLKDKGFLEKVINASNYSSVTRQKAKNYVEFNVKQSTP